jgi:two-component system KDP operon response regulator KdpE
MAGGDETNEPAPRSRLLVVDDEPAIVKALRETHSRQGYEIVGVTDGQVALARLQGEPFDLLLADLGMPGIGGVELL